MNGNDINPKTLTQRKAQPLVLTSESRRSAAGNVWASERFKEIQAESDGQLGTYSA